MFTFQPGQQVSHFEIVDKLGAGASGEVYRAEDIYLRRPVALKFLTRYEDRAQQELFLQEARLCASFVHPNIAVLYEIGWHDKVPFLAMELVEGEMLSRRVRTGIVTREQALRYTDQILGALEEAHSRGIVHRDIKSSNIVVATRDSVKILDFGTAKRAISAKDSGGASGTLEFLSPEQARGEEADFRSDLFSTGVILYQLFTSRLPFERDTDVATLQAILNDAPLPVSSLLSNVPESFDIVLRKALAKDPAERYQSAAQFLADLKAIDWTVTSPARLIVGPIQLAVLYFERVGPEEESRYLQIGVTEDIITDLAKVAGIRVLSRHAVQKYKDKPIQLKDVMRELQVQYLLQGTVQKSGDRIRMTAQLMDAASAAPVWAEKYDRSMKDIFDLEDDVARHIAQALKIALTESEQESIRSRSTSNVQAYDYYLRGRYHYAQANAENNLQAEKMFRKSTELDPQFAPAYASLSETFVQRYYNWFDRERKWLKNAEDIIGTAYKLNDQLPEVHCTYGMLLYLRGDYEQAMEEIQKALRLDPHYALAHDHTGEIYLHRGEMDRALIAFHTEMQINPDVIYPYFYLTWIHSLTGDFSAANEVLEKAKRKHPRNALLIALEGIMASYSGELSVAQERLQQVIAGNPSNTFATGRLAVVFAEMGNREESLKLLDAVEKIDALDHHTAFDRGCVMALLNDYAESFLWLNRAIEFGWQCEYHFRTDRNLKSVRSMPEFQDLLGRLR